MTKPKPKPEHAADAVRAAIERELAKRDNLKPIEVVKIAISAYQAFASDSAADAPAYESADRAGLRRGMQASIDRLLFNVNYWRAAYEDRIVAACPTAEDADACLQAASAWNSHTMKLNNMPAAEVAESFERFCPPFAVNKRRGSSNRAGAGKGPVSDFRTCALDVAKRAGGEAEHALHGIVSDMEAEAAFYEQYADASTLDAFYDLLPAWCLQERIELVNGLWWNDSAVMQVIAEHLRNCFAKLGYAEPLCGYFLDAMSESLDGYTREMTIVESPFQQSSIPQLVELVRAARAAHPDSETDGYGSMLPSWLAPKEQLIWNTIVCAIYGPMHARPLLADDLGLLPVDGKPASIDVITDLAERAYTRYLAIRRASGIAPEFESFSSQPEGLRISGLERIESIPEKLKVLGYRVVPAASCYPEQRIEHLRGSEVECLAFLEHRRWLDERRAAGWTYAPHKDVQSKQSPYLVDWDDLPDRAREWNRSATRDIPGLLASVGLAISR